MTQAFEAAVAAFQPRLPLAVAFSGGADSTALLLACLRRWPGQVRALHVHHGLQAAADEFEAFCRQRCGQWAVPLAVRHIDARHAEGDSPEDAARRGRYAALDAMLSEEWPQDKVQTLALAQHADDQIETLLLALSRGAGLPGLAAMPARWMRGEVRCERPLLSVAGADVRAWLQSQGESWIEDPSNRNQLLTRNRIRHQLLPALQQAFPQFRDTFARSAAHAAQAQGLLDELAAADLNEVGVPPRLSALQALSPARQTNVLRHWLQRCHATTPSTAQLQELLKQLQSCRTRGHRIELKVGSGWLRREGAVLGWYN